MNPTPSVSSVTLREVGLRDGLQAISRTLPTALKKRWLQAEYDAGVREIEVGSFVPPARLPQLADTGELVAFAKTLPGLFVSVLVPNLKGALAALQSGADAMLLPLSASRAHSLANLRKEPSAVLAELEQLIAARDEARSPCLVEVGLSTAFGCTLQGAVAHGDVLHLVKAAHHLGVDRIGLADTVGYADPRAVRELFEASARTVGRSLDCAHFHDTRGLGLANVMAAFNTGVRRFDACLAGLGGCPHAPGASGNVVTEDLAYLFASMGEATGVALGPLLALRAELATWLEGETLHGTLWRAGLPKTLTLQAT